MSASIKATQKASQKSLSYDVGLIADIEDNLKDRLGLPREQATQVLITPILRKGTLLPATFKGADLGVPLLISQETNLELDLVVDDRTDFPWIQHWEIAYFGGKTERIAVEWEICADADGALTLRLKPEEGQPIEVKGRWERDTARLVVAGAPSLTRITPEQLRQAWQQAA
jgi:hypothetical protein